VPTRGKDNNRVPYFKLPIHYIPEDDKEADPSYGKPPSVKLLLDSTGKAIDSPTIQAQPIFKGGTTDKIFKWFQSLSSLLEGKSVVATSLRGTDKALWQRELDPASPELAESAGLSDDATEQLWYDSITRLTKHVLKDPEAGFKQVRYIERYLWIGKIPVFGILWIVLTPFRLTCLFFHL
jgi:hypothetical protein